MSSSPSLAFAPSHARAQPQEPFRQYTAPRFYFCPGCSTGQSGASNGGSTTCPHCGAAWSLPPRAAASGDPRLIGVSDNSPARLQMLHMQDGTTRGLSPSLAAVLGSASLQAGREQEAIAIWQSLRARSTQGDVAASEDLSMLTLMLSQHPPIEAVPNLVAALNESACDAAVLPRHRSQALGMLAREAARTGDLEAAHRYLSSMAPNPPELEADSQLRLSSAVVATVMQDPQRVLAALGPRRGVVPVAEMMDAMATVLRANAYEQSGALAVAQEVLGELPSPRVLDQVRAGFPRHKLCEKSGASYAAAAAKSSAQAASLGASWIGVLLGGILVATGVIVLALGVALATFSQGPSGLLDPGFLGCGVPGLALSLGGAVVIWRAVQAGRHAAWLSTNGLSLEARVTSAEATGTAVNDVPQYRLSLQVAGPKGSYAASVTRLMREHQIAALLGSTVRVRANPEKLEDLALET